MKFYQVIESIVAKQSKLIDGQYAADDERQQVCYEFIDWLLAQKDACEDYEVDSVKIVEEEQWATFCEINDVDPKRRVYRKYGFDTLNYYNNEEW